MTPYTGWKNTIPPTNWVRILSFDTGGATSNNMELAAICPETQSLVFYQEVNKVTTNMRLMAELMLPHLKPEESNEEYNFLAKIGDYENRVALHDLAEHGIKFTNAVKHDKNLSVQRLSGYLHPNPKRPFPAWHPNAGQLGAPLMYITENCPFLIEDIPQQKWKKPTGGSGGVGVTVKDEMDRTVRHDSVDCALYIVRLLPAPATIPIPKISTHEDTRSLQSRMYWEDVARAKANEAAPARKPYSASHDGGNQWKLSSGLS